MAKRMKGYSVGGGIIGFVIGLLVWVSLLSFGFIWISSIYNIELVNPLIADPIIFSILGLSSILFGGIGLLHQFGLIKG